MSLLSIIQNHCKLHAIGVPSSVIGSTDTNTVQLYAIISEVLSELVTESNFQVINQEAIKILTAVEDQGAMQTLCPNGYQSAIFETFFDRTLRRPLFGPISESEWQGLKALPTAGTLYKFRIKNDHLFINPIPTTTLSTIAWEYMSSWCVKSAGGTLQSGLLADTDVFVFPENLIQRGLIFRWKQIKGLPYQADETKFYNLLNNYIAKDKVKRRINVAENDCEFYPGIFVPSGDWLV